MPCVQFIEFKTSMWSHVSGQIYEMLNPRKRWRHSYLWSQLNHFLGLQLILSEYVILKEITWTSKLISFSICVPLVQRQWHWMTVYSCPTCRPRGTTCCCFIPERFSSWTWSSARRWVWWQSSDPGYPSFRWAATHMRCKFSVTIRKFVEIGSLKRSWPSFWWKRGR